MPVLFKIFLGSFFFFLLTACENLPTNQAKEDKAAKRAPITYVNPLIGTAAQGHTYPGATTPFGMIQISPDTRNEGTDRSSGYHYSDRSIMGFSHTHLSGSERGDLLDILLMPMTGGLKTRVGKPENPEEGYRSRFSHESEQATPGYYQVFLEDYQINVELTSSLRAGFHRYTLPIDKQVHIILDPTHGQVGDQINGAYLHIVNDTLITGYRRSRGWGENGETYWVNQQVYFAAAFSKPFESFGTIQGDRVSDENQRVQGNFGKAFVSYQTNESGGTVMVKVGISSVDEQGAIRNLQGEIPHWNFEQTRKEAQALWEKELNKVEVEAKEAELETFYTALYHTMLSPNLFADVDGRYRNGNGQILTSRDSLHYTNFFLGSTFRTKHPLHTLLHPNRVNDFITAMLTHYQTSGLLPVWVLQENETNYQTGYPAVSVITDAYLKGIRQYDETQAYQAARKSATQGNFGRQYLDNYGYIPANADKQSVSRTLEYAYDDWAMAQLAKALDKEADYERFAKRSLAYQKLIDPEDFFVKGKNTNGTFQQDFDPTNPEGFGQGNAWQYTWYAPHDVYGLIDTLGGNQRFVSKLDSLFSYEALTSKDSLESKMVLVGQYAPAFGPSYHIPYLYTYAGEPWKAQAQLHTLMTTLYRNEPEGLPGNEGSGALSAWYIFNALGFYPVNSAGGIYVFGKPAFTKVTLKLPNGKTFTVEAQKLSAKNIFVQSIQLNGQAYPELFISHSQILEGGKLTFTMGPKPNQELGKKGGKIPASVLKLSPEGS